MIVPFFMGAENDSGKIQGENTGKKEGMTEMVEALPATSRHTRRLLRLLPSGPDRVNKLVLRENQQGPHCHYWLSSLYIREAEAVCIIRDDRSKSKVSADDRCFLIQPSLLPRPVKTL